MISKSLFSKQIVPVIQHQHLCPDGRPLGRLRACDEGDRQRRQEVQLDVL